MNWLKKFIGREQSLFFDDIKKHEEFLKDQVSQSSFLIVGGAGSIGQAVTKEIFARNPKKLHVVDLSENTLVELVRDLRSTLGYGDGEFATYSLDFGTLEFEAFFKSNGPYDYVINLSALKHVRSERDPYTLMRMIKVNILDTLNLIRLAEQSDTTKFFCVSTDKAANPVNMMGASKRIMELCVFELKRQVPVSTARFANVLFSYGSLPAGFTQRLEKGQPIAAPNDIKRYFVTQEESGQLCLLSILLGNDRNVFFPKPEKLELFKFSDLAMAYLESKGLEPYLCQSEEEARQKVAELSSLNRWPCYFSGSDTTGEKPFEEFFREDETPDRSRFESVGVIQCPTFPKRVELEKFLEQIGILRKNRVWSKTEIVQLFQSILPEFHHLEVLKSLDNKM
jgi:FlaA1/EpsC-like NDP-sugar epimerase